MWCETLGWLVKISIHALHEESDLILGNHDDVLYGFQSTLSMRRATTLFLVIKSLKSLFQSTLSMRRATR